MKNGKKVIYWDACIYITILEGDKKDQNLKEQKKRIANNVTTR